MNQKSVTLIKILKHHQKLKKKPTHTHSNERWKKKKKRSVRLFTCPSFQSWKVCIPECTRWGHWSFTIIFFRLFFITFSIKNAINGIFFAIFRPFFVFKWWISVSRIKKSSKKWKRKRKDENKLLQYFSWNIEIFV